ncbi:hypothetical protein GCM10009731_60910 [Streptomyces globosus]
MIVYRLSSPIDFFTEYTPLPDWLSDAVPQKAAWFCEAILALDDAAVAVRREAHVGTAGTRPRPSS